MFRFKWTGERKHTSDDDDDEGAISSGAAGIATNADGEGLYWKVVASGQIAQSVSVGEGDSGDVTLRI